MMLWGQTKKEPVIIILSSHFTPSFENEYAPFLQPPSASFSLTSRSTLGVLTETPSLSYK